MAPSGAAGDVVDIDLCFRLTAADVALLADALVVRDVARYEADVQRIDAAMDRIFPLLLLVAPLLALVVQGWATGSFGAGPSASDWRVTAVVAAVYVVLWWRWGDKLAGWIRQRRRRTDTGWRGWMRRQLARPITSSLSRLQGRHVLRVGEEALTLHAPDSPQGIVIPWQKIVRIVDTGPYYRIFTRQTQRLGVAYVLPKHTSEMPQSTFDAGLARVLRRSPVPLEQTSSAPERSGLR